jgi:hypothetical protein
MTLTRINSLAAPFTKDRRQSMPSEEKSQKKDMSGPDYIRAAFQLSDRLAILVRNRKRGETLQRITTAAKIVGPPFQDWLHFKNDKEGFDVYVGMNPLKASARTRTKEDVDAIRHLYIDVDHDGARSLTAIEQSNLVPPPNYVLNTSHDRLQVVWKVEGIPQGQAEALLHAMARKFGGDPAATDSTRVLRLPGFVNKKHDLDFLVTAELRSQRVNHLQDFKLRIDSVESAHEPHRYVPSRSSESPSRHLSQSEHDWAYAKRALARGTCPEDVIRNIAEFRAYDKHNPHDYASRTVNKALADLNLQQSPSAETRPQDGANDEGPRR